LFEDIDFRPEIVPTHACAFLDDIFDYRALMIIKIDGAFASGKTEESHHRKSSVAHVP
jgi:hypothetical protein